MLFPRKVKHRKWHTRRKNKNKVSVATRGATVSFGSHGLKATTEGRVTSNQIEAARKVIRRAITKQPNRICWANIPPTQFFLQQ